MLDYVRETVVAAIHIIDGDAFLQRNAFRAPGAASVDMLQPQPFKVDYFAQIYSRVDRNILPHAVYLNADKLNLLDGMDYAFSASTTAPPSGSSSTGSKNGACRSSTSGWRRARR